jgi:cellobiose-specific phosphotransferase system component IIA
MIGITAREILDTAMTLAEGQRIVTQCNNYQEMESLRTNLYKARKALLKTHRTLAYSLYISREIKGDNFFVVITKELSVSNVVIIDKDGSIKPFERIESAVTGEETEEERMVKLMKEDGMTEEEISDFLAEKGEDEFDKAASKIEEAQDKAGKTKKKGGKK